MEPHGRGDTHCCGRLFWAATLDQDSPASKRAEQFEAQCAQEAAERYGTQHGLCTGQKIVVGFALSDGGVKPSGIHVFDVIAQIKVVKSR